VDARDRRLGGEDDFDQAALKELLDQFLEIGKETAWCMAKPRRSVSPSRRRR